MGRVNLFMWCSWMCTCLTGLIKFPGFNLSQHVYELRPYVPIGATRGDEDVDDDDV